MKKRLLSLITATVLALLATFSFAACAEETEPEPPDVFFAGALSEKTYDSADDAARGFLETEVAGDVTDASFVAYEKEGELSQEEIDGLALTEEEKADVTSAEQGTVEYEESDESEVRTAATKRKKVKVYVIYIRLTYRYYAPALQSGDVLTKAYFDRVFDKSKYVNFTLEQTTTTSVSSKQMGIPITLSTYTVNQSIRYEGRYAHEITATTSKALTSVEKSREEWFYVFDTNVYGRLVAIYKCVEDEWSRVNFSTVTVGGLGVAPSNDYSFFVKTETGFTVNSEKYSRFIKDVVDEILESLGDESPISSLKVNSEYFVRDGKLHHQTMTGSFKMNVDGVYADGKINAKQTYRDFETTKVDVPDIVAADFVA